MIELDDVLLCLSHGKQLTTGRKMKLKFCSGRYLTKNEFLGSNMKTTYFLCMKNLIKPKNKYDLQD